ncbi:MAG TPA: alkaline phosphatase family protein [Candidatus Cybelea sp.]
MQGPFQRNLTLTVAVMLLLCACGHATGPSSSSGLPPTDLGALGAPLRPDGRSKKIQHVVIIVQENRSLNNLFYGYPGAKTATYGYDSENQKVPLKPISLKTRWDLQHNARGFILSCNGKGAIPGTDCQMNGFDKESCNDAEGPCPKSKHLAYAYVPHSETLPYFTMAKQYVLADEMYASDFDISSFESHQYIIAGVNPNSTVDYPLNGAAWGCTGGPAAQIDILEKGRTWGTKTERPCWDPKTLADELDTASLPWAFYAVPLNAGGSGGTACGGSGAKDDTGTRHGIWSAYQAIKHICYGPDWDQDVQPFSPPSKFLNDVAKGELRTVTWITPTCADSDHGGCDSATGPSWVASVVNAVGQSKFWSSSAIFIFWDDSGGWYDPEPPAYEKNSDYDGLGYRLPLLIISPYAKKGYVDHTHYEHGSILKFVEDTFNLSRLNLPYGSDVRANSPDDAFDFSQAPRKFVTIQAPYHAEHFLREQLDMQPPDTD